MKGKRSRVVVEVDTTQLDQGHRQSQEVGHGSMHSFCQHIAAVNIMLLLLQCVTAVVAVSAERLQSVAVLQFAEAVALHLLL